MIKKGNENSGTQNFEEVNIKVDEMIKDLFEHLHQLDQEQKEEIVSKDKKASQV